MVSRVFTAIIGLSIALLSAARAADGPAAADEGALVFSDTFTGPRLSPEWEVHDGQCEVADGALTIPDGGTVSLKKLPGGSFAMEFEIAFPSSWMSVIPLFTGPRDYATLYLGAGYWESFQLAGSDDGISGYVQHVDPDIVRTGGFQKVKVVSDFGTIRFVYDGKEKGPVSFPFRPGARVGFRSLPRTGVLKIRNFRLTKLPQPQAKVVRVLAPADLAKAIIWKDRGIEGQPGATGQSPSVDAQTTAAVLNYAFASDDQFESCFVRIPVEAGACGRIFLDVEGDGSRNNVFVIFHDASGEQHLVLKSPIAWQGWQEVGINLAPYLRSPENMERLAIHWGGDANQRIDFPITAVDIGVAKHVPSVRPAGQLRLRNVRFVE